jgi:hypothetical protein
MDDDNKIIKLAAAGFIGLVMVPIVIRVTTGLANSAVCGISNAVERRRYNKRIKKGLKDGSIVKIDGVYYEVCEMEED